LNRSHCRILAALGAGILTSLNTFAQDSVVTEPASPSAPEQGEFVVLAETPHAVTEEGRFYRTWTKMVTKQNRATGEVVTEPSSYVEIASGLNYRDPADATGQDLVLLEAPPDSRAARSVGRNALGGLYGVDR